MTTATIDETLGSLSFKKSPYGRTWENSPMRFSDRPDGQSIVYIAVEGETIAEQLYARRTRPYTLLRKPLEDILRANGIRFSKLRWSQKAGCGMCPCSPGFVIEGGDRGSDYWLTLSK